MLKPNDFFGVLFPQKCPFCGNLLPHGQLSCLSCAKMLPAVRPPICAVCGRGVAFCNCNKNYHFDRCIAPFYYERQVASAIKRMKFAENRRGIPVLAREMSLCVQSEYESVRLDACAFVPMTKKAVRARGFNQSQLLAEYIAADIGIPLDRQALVKNKETLAQHSLPAAKRAKNAAGVYQAGNANLQGKNILLVDDILTTGATLSACAKALKEGGAQAVFGIVLALAVL
jgi:competence protein ComFC